MFADLEDYIRQTYEEARRAASGAVEDATLHGEDRMREIIELSTTPTGDARAARGGHPGRIDSGDMIDDIESNIDAVGQDRIVGSYGWINGLEPYYAFQELGAEDFNVRFKGMRALAQSSVEARELLFKRLREEGFR